MLAPHHATPKECNVKYNNITNALQPAPFHFIEKQSPQCNVNAAPLCPVREKETKNEIIRRYCVIMNFRKC